MWVGWSIYVAWAAVVLAITACSNRMPQHTVPDLANMRANLAFTCAHEADHASSLPQRSLKPAFACLAVLLALPSSVWAEAYSGLATFVFSVCAIGFLIWCGLTALVYRSLRHGNKHKRTAITTLFFFFPVIALFLDIEVDELKGLPGRIVVDSSSSTPVALGGVVFPAGSEVKYEQEGNGVWRKHPVEATTRQTPVSLGTLQIRSLRLAWGHEDSLEVVLNKPQVIDGWRCSTDEVALNRDKDSVTLQSCVLADLVSLNGIHWPVGTWLRKSTEGNWQLNWRIDVYDDCSQTSEAFGFPVIEMSAEYDRQMKLLNWSGKTCNGNTKIGRLTIGPWTNVQPLPNGMIKLDRENNDGDSHAQPACLLFDPRKQSAKPCT